MAIKPKLCLIPSAVGDGTLYSVLPSTGVGDFDFSRSGTATRVNAQGLIETVDANTPRLNYPLIDGEVSGCPSLLLEPSRTNLYSYSNQFDVYWSKSNISAIPNSIISPEGILNGYFLRENTSNASHDIRQNATIVSGLQYTYSVFVKKSDVGQDRNLSFYIGGTNGSISFNTTNGTFFNVGSVDSYSSEDYGNGWWRLQFTDTSVSTSFNVIAILNNGSTIYSGDGVSGVYIYGAQLEQGSYATSYIPTSGGIGTRVAETANGAGDADTFNDSEGVLYAEMSALAEDGGFRDIRLNDGTSNNRVAIRYSFTTNEIEVYVVSNGVETFKGEYISQSTVDFNKIAIKYKENNFSFFVNGVKLATSTSGSTPFGLNNINFSIPSFNFYGKVKDLRVYNTVLTDAELEDLTSWDSFSEMATGQLYTIE